MCDNVWDLRRRVLFSSMCHVGPGGQWESDDVMLSGLDEVQAPVGKERADSCQSSGQQITAKTFAAVDAFHGCGKK